MTSPCQKVNKPRKLEIMRNKKKVMLREIAAFGLVKLVFVALSFFPFFLCCCCPVTDGWAAGHTKRIESFFEVNGRLALARAR